MTLNRPDDTYVRNAAELTELWQNMMGPGGFGGRSLWLVFLYENGRLSPVVIPIDFAATALLLSRPGSDQVTASDRAWARACAAAFGSLAPWPVHLATRGKVRVLAPDDLIVGRSA